MDGAGRSLRHFFDKVRKWHFHSTSNEVIWPKKFTNSMHGSKSAILAIFPTGPGWPGTVSAALKNPSQDFKNYFCLGFLFLLIVFLHIAMLENEIRETRFFKSSIWALKLNSLQRMDRKTLSSCFLMTLKYSLNSI